MLALAFNGIIGFTNDGHFFQFKNCLLANCLVFFLSIEVVFDVFWLLLIVQCTGKILTSFFQSWIANIYTPGIYADGYIVFAFPFVRSYVRSFVIPSRSWNLRPSFALKFLKWCIPQQLLIRKHSYLDHSYPGGLAFTP